MSSSDVAILEDEDQLLKLINLVYNNEEPLAMNITSEPERANYLKKLNEGYDNTMSMLKDAKEMDQSFKREGDLRKHTIAQDILKYIKYAINVSMQNVRNCCLRAGCISKIKTHFDSLAEQLTDLETKDLVQVEALAEEVSTYKQLMLESVEKCRSGSSRAISRAFSNQLKENGTSFAELITEYQNKLHISGEFDTLEDTEKYKVLKSIIDDSERAAFPKLELASGVAGAAVLVFTASMMVWDIFTAEQGLEAVISNALDAASEIGAFAVQVFVEGLVTEAVVDVELGVFFVALAGFIVGSLAGLVFVAASGLIVDEIFGSSGSKAPDFSGLEFHSVGQMPDGMKIALQIAHEKYD